MKNKGVLNSILIITFMAKVIFYAGMLSCSHDGGKKIKGCMVTSQAKKYVEAFYDLFKYEPGKKANLFSENLMTKARALEDKFYEEFSQHCDSKSTKSAVQRLKKEFFEVVKTDSAKPYLLWRNNFKSSAWWKALNGSIKDFLVYLYSINSSFWRSKSGITVKASKDGSQYIFDGKVLKVEYLKASI